MSLNAKPQTVFLSASEKEKKAADKQRNLIKLGQG